MAELSRRSCSVNKSETKKKQLQEELRSAPSLPTYSHMQITTLDPGLEGHERTSDKQELPWNHNLVFKRRITA